ncbi:hypothetical protein HanIR_Chr13g0651371 [Helianthus annuus]|nr:hypothetical protein HanIR_Chr13g0651371 [Helianthus annuus]
MKTFSTKDSVQVVHKKPLKPFYSVFNVHIGIFGASHVYRSFSLHFVTINRWVYQIE